MQLIGNYHDNILGCIDVLQDDDYLYTIMPYCEGGDLFGRVMGPLHLQRTASASTYGSVGSRRSSNDSPGHSVNEDQARRWFKQLLSVSSLHVVAWSGVENSRSCLAAPKHVPERRVVDLARVFQIWVLFYSRQRAFVYWMLIGFYLTVAIRLQTASLSCYLHKTNTMLWLFSVLCLLKTGSEPSTAKRCMPS